MVSSITLGARILTIVSVQNCLSFLELQLTVFLQQTNPSYSQIHNFKFRLQVMPIAHIM